MDDEKIWRMTSNELKLVTSLLRQYRNQNENVLLPKFESEINSLYLKLTEQLKEKNS